MLGRLARWLRILGHDVVYFHRIEDSDLVDLAARESRILLTRDTRLVLRKAARGALLIHGHLLEDQLRQMLHWNRKALLAPRLCRRCLECNVPTEPVRKQDLENRVPVYVFRTQARFRACPACGRVYWKATHVRDMLRRLSRSLS
jgi:uncharacterized protein with PIN domain